MGWFPPTNFLGLKTDIVELAFHRYINYTYDSLISLSCKIFEHFALQVDPVEGFIQPGSTQFKSSATLAPKLADPPFWWKSLAPPPLNQDPV